MEANAKGAGLPKENVFAGCLNPKPGDWELDLSTNELFWSDEQYRIYGYEPGEIAINDDFFILKTTHPSDIHRIKSIVDDAIKKSLQYTFKRRILKKDGSIGYARTRAEIVRTKGGAASRIIGCTVDITEPREYYHPAAFEKVYADYQKSILTAITRIIKDKSVSEDICQETFLKAWSSISTYDLNKGKLYTWLVHIARNLSFDYLKSKNYLFVKNSSLLNDSIQKSGTCATSNRINAMYVKELLKELTKEQKEIIELLFIEGYTQAEVSEMKKMPLGTTKTKSRMALKKMKLLGCGDNKRLGC